MPVGPIKRAKKSKKGRKIGRNANYCNAYKAAKKHENSHIRRLEAHVARQPMDSLAQDALKRYVALAR